MAHQSGCAPLHLPVKDHLMSPSSQRLLLELAVDGKIAVILVDNRRGLDQDESIFLGLLARVSCVACETIGKDKPSVLVVGAGDHCLNPISNSDTQDMNCFGGLLHEHASWGEMSRNSLASMLLSGPQVSACKVDSIDWAQHIRSGHWPPHRRCKYCIMASAQQRAHRRQHSPASFCLCLDVVGPFAPVADDISHKRRYALVGALVVPVDARGKPVLGEDQEQAPAADDDKDAGAPDVDQDLGDLLKDIDEWFGAPGDGVSAIQVNSEIQLEGERLDAPAGESLQDAQGQQTFDLEKEAAGMAWREIVFVELLDTKTPKSVCLAVGRIHAQLVELGFPLVRIHADAGTEFADDRLKEYASSRGILLTLDASKWALAFRSAAATWRAVLVRHWLRRRQRDWHMRATPAVVLAPATYVRQGYVVKVGNKLSVVTKLHFGEESDLKLFVGKGLPPIAEPGAVRRRMRSKVPFDRQAAVDFVLGFRSEEGDCGEVEVVLDCVKVGSDVGLSLVDSVQSATLSCVGDQTSAQVACSGNRVDGEAEQAPWDLSELTAHIEELDRENETVDASGDTDLSEVQGDGADTVLQTRTVSLPEVLANWEVWEHPANKEISALVEEKRALIPVDWKQVQRWKESGKRVTTIPAKAVWTIKAPDGRHKCRIVACGNMAPSKDESRQDHKDAVFASSLDVTHLRCALAVATRRSYEIAITDIRTAFLNAELLPRERVKAEQAAAAAADGESVPIDEIVILLPPRCLIQRGLVGRNTLWQVAKAIYGLDTSPRDWSLSRDFTLRRLAVKFQVGEVVVDDYYYHVEMWRTGMVNSGFVQESYIKDLADRYSHELQKVKQCGTPLGPGVMEPEAVENIDSGVLRTCQRLIGEILWVSVRTRPDVSFSISKLAQWMNRDPSKTYQLGLHVLAYLVDSANVGLVYLCSDPSGPRPGRKEAHVYLLAELAQKAPRVHIYNDNQDQSSHDARAMGTKPLGAQRVKSFEGYAEVFASSEEDYQFTLLSQNSNRRLSRQAFGSAPAANRWHRTPRIQLFHPGYAREEIGQVEFTGRRRPLSERWVGRTEFELARQRPCQQGERRYCKAKCADTYIGLPAARDDLIRGISGGEKKRTCVAIELIVLCGVSRFRQRLLFESQNLEDESQSDFSFTVPVDLQLLVLPFCSTRIEEVEEFVDLVAHGQVEEVEEVLQRPQDPNLKPGTYFQRPIWFAAVSDKVDVLRLLLEAGAEVGPRDRPLLAAAEVGRVEVVRVLLEAGARHEAEDPDDNEALCAASEHGHLEVVRLLLGAGFDKHIPNRSGKTPSELAAKRVWHQALKSLLFASRAVPMTMKIVAAAAGAMAFQAQNVIQKLRDLAAKEGCNVLCTIHQPSSEVFHLFNKVMLLHAGRLFFFGMVHNLSRELAGVGHACPAEYNLADHVMFLLQKESDTSLELMHSKFAWKVAEEDDELVTREKSRIIAQGRTAGFCLQLWSLTKREAQGVWRNVPGLVASVVMPAVLNLLFALIFFQVGDVNAADYTEMAHFGGLFQARTDS
ncbi:abcG4 [Symbiodinium sp. KB8]|nr:abcG4 [Symbiodinium sp. KB8]